MISLSLPSIISLCLAFLLSFAVFSLPCSPLMTSAPLGVLCPYPSCFSRPSHLHSICSWVQTSGVLKWLFTCWCSSRAPLFVISVAESPGPSRHCLSSAPAPLPSQAPLVIIMTSPFGVTHVFAASPNCSSYSWGFRHLQELQMEFLPLPPKSLMPPNFKKPASLFPFLPLTIPLCFPWCSLVCWFKSVYWE